jgi:hypothetical protein
MAWNELIRQVNALIDDCVGKDVTPLDLLEPNHILTSGDISAVQNKLIELCDENSFEDIPALWEVATIDELMAAINAGVCGECEEDCEDVDEGYNSYNGLVISWPISGQTFWSIVDWAPWLSGKQVDPKYQSWELYFSDGMAMVSFGPIVREILVPAEPPSEENPDGVDEVAVGVITIDEDPPRWPSQAIGEPTFDEFGNNGFIYRIEDAQGTVLLDGIEVMFFEIAPPVPGPALIGSNRSSPVSLSNVFPYPFPDQFILRLKCQ